MKRTVLTMMNTAAEKYSDYPYLANKSDDGWDKISFSETRTRAKIIAGALFKRGFKKDDPFTIIAEGRSEWVISELAVIMIGGISVPLS